MEEAQTVQNKLKKSGRVFASRRSDDYLLIRSELEDKARDLFIQKGGCPVRSRPHYMTWGETPWLQQWYEEGRGPAWKRTAVNMLRLVDDSPAARALYAGLRPHWANPATPSVVSASDALVKQAAVIEGLGESDVALEQLGWDQDVIARFRSDQRRNRGARVLEQLAAIGRTDDNAE